MTTTLLMWKDGLSSCTQWGSRLFTTAMQKSFGLKKLKTGFALLASMTLRLACYGQSIVMSSAGLFEYIQIWCMLCALRWAYDSGAALLKDTQAMAWMLRKLLTAAVQRALLFFLHISLMLPNRLSSSGQTSAWCSQVSKHQFKYFQMLLLFSQIKYKECIAEALGCVHTYSSFPLITLV